MGSVSSKVSPIASALFGITRQAVLRLLLESSDQRFYQRQIVRELRLGHGAVQRELSRLTEAGILLRTVEGRQTYYQANKSCPIFEELRGLIRKTIGIAGVLQKSLRPLSSNIPLAFIFGSMAKADHTVDSDIDVMIVSDTIGMRDAVKAFKGAQTELHREVNPSIYSTEEFHRRLAAGDHFLAHVAANPKLFLIGDEREFAELASIRIPDTAPNQPARDC